MKKLVTKWNFQELFFAIFLTAKKFYHRQLCAFFALHWIQDGRHAKKTYSHRFIHYLVSWLFKWSNHSSMRQKQINVKKDYDFHNYCHDFDAILAAICRFFKNHHIFVIFQHIWKNDMSNYRFSGSTNSNLTSNQLYNLPNMIWRQYDGAKRVGHYQIFLKSPDICYSWIYLHGLCV